MKLPILNRLGSVGAVLALSVIAMAGCGGSGGSSAGIGGGPRPNPSPAGSPPVTTLNVVHINFFGPGNGVFNDATFGPVSGYTQHLHAQVLGLTPGEAITLTNNDTTAHTFNVFASGFPSGTLDSTPSGGTVLQDGYRSGAIAPGASVTLTVGPAGKYFIACAFHFGMSPSMRDGLMVQVGAVPGAEATPAATPGTGGCTGYGC